MSELQTELRTILGSKQPIGRIGRAIIDLLGKAPSGDARIELLAIAVTERDAVDKCETELNAKDVTEELWKKLLQSEQLEIKRFLRINLFEARDAAAFGGALLKFLGRYPSKETKAFLLANILYSWYLPFKPLPGKPEALSDEARDRALEAHADAFAMMHHIAILPFKKTTEMAGLALKVLDSVDDPDARVALLAMLIHRCQSVAGMSAERRAQAMSQVGAPVQAGPGAR